MGIQGKMHHILETYLHVYITCRQGAKCASLHGLEGIATVKLDASLWGNQKNWPYLEVKWVKWAQNWGIAGYYSNLQKVRFCRDKPKIAMTFPWCEASSPRRKWTMHGQELQKRPRICPMFGESKICKVTKKYHGMELAIHDTHRLMPAPGQQLHQTAKWY